MADYTGERKHFRFPAFTDAQGVKLTNETPRQIFSEDEPVFITKSPLRNEQDYGLRHLDEIDAANEAANEREIEWTPTKEKDWQPGKSAGLETKNIAFTVAKTKYEPVKKTSTPIFNPTHQASVAKRTKEKSWLPEDLEARINKHTALEQKLANTRFADDKNKFTPRYVPEQMYGVDPLVQEAQEKNNLAKQLSEEKTDFLTFATADEMTLPELTSETDNQINKTPTLETHTTRVSPSVEISEKVEEKRSIPQIVERDFMLQPKSTLKAIKADLETPAINKKQEEIPNRSRLEKSLSGIISEQGPMKNNSYFKE